MDKIIITISRQYGSGGKTIGEMLSKDLNIPVYDRKILRLASDESGISEELFGKSDEKVRNSPLYRISRNIYKGQLIPPESDEFVSDDNLFNYQAKVIQELAEEESCIMIGRCANYILKDYSNVVRVFVHAPEWYCVKKVKEINGVTEKEALKEITKIDKYRKQYYEYHTGKIWNDARQFDLCLDSSVLGFEKCVEIIKEYIKIRFDNTF